MAVDAKTVRDVASLARLALDEERIDALASEMESILDFMGAISQWEGACEPDNRQPAARRIDTPGPTKPTLFQAAAKVDQTSVVVPPVKGAS